MKMSLLVLIISLYWLNDIQESTPKTKCLCSGSPRRQWDIFPPEFQLAFHIYYVKYENKLTCKRISWNSGGGGGGDDVSEIFFYFLYV